MTDWAVLPVENSLGGSIHTVYDLLLRYRLHIVGETSISVNHCLLALPGTKLTDLKRVISHPQVRICCPQVVCRLNNQHTSTRSSCCVRVCTVGNQQLLLRRARRCDTVAGSRLQRACFSWWCSGPQHVTPNALLDAFYCLLVVLCCDVCCLLLANRRWLRRTTTCAT